METRLQAWTSVPYMGTLYSLDLWAHEHTVHTWRTGHTGNTGTTGTRGTRGTGPGIPGLRRLLNSCPYNTEKQELFEHQAISDSPLFLNKYLMHWQNKVRTYDRVFVKFSVTFPMKNFCKVDVKVFRMQEKFSYIEANCFLFPSNIFDRTQARVASAV